MADPVLERDIQVMEELEHCVERGDVEADRTLTAMTCKVAGNVTKWQWIIHGDTAEYRRVVCRWLCMQKKFTLARRFAMCGRGDSGFNEYGGDGVKVVPMGCGCRFCPRCSRRFGRRFLQRVSRHLCGGPHGAIWHVVLTQRVQRSETLQEAKERFAKSWKRFYTRLRKLGLKSALCTYHVKASLNGGWHYHCHLLAEWEPNVDEAMLGERVSEDWHWAMKDSGTATMEVFARPVVGPGEAFGSDELQGQGELWKESVDPVMAALQYVVRDVLQGVEKWVGQITSIENAGSFAEALGGAKLHRLYGAWRRQFGKVAAAEKAADVVSVAGTAAKSGCGKGDKAWTLIGRMDEVLWGAKTGQGPHSLCVHRLLGLYSNRGAVSKRLRQLVKFFAVS